MVKIIERSVLKVNQSKLDPYLEYVKTSRNPLVRIEDPYAPTEKQKSRLYLPPWNRLHTILLMSLFIPFPLDNGPGLPKSQIQPTFRESPSLHTLIPSPQNSSSSSFPEKHTQDYVQYSNSKNRLFIHVALRVNIIQRSILRVGYLN